MPTPKHIQSRVAALRERLSEKYATSGGALLVTNSADVQYLTGFTGGDSWLVVPLAGGRVHLLSDFRYTEQVRQQAPHVHAIIRKKSFGEELAKLVKRAKLKKLLLQRGYVTLAQRKLIVKHVGASKVGDCDDGLLDQRAVKDDTEVKLIRRAIDIQQRAFLDLRRFVKPGVSETEAAAFLEFRMRSLGADGTSFDTILAVGKNASKPHAFPSPRVRLKRGDMVQADWGAKFNGYCSDMSRVLTLGKPHRKLRDIYHIVLEAHLAAIDAVRPGVAFKDIDAAARSVIKKAGYAKQFGHGTGHGIGLDIHENPVVSFRSKETAAPGHVITIEPGIYLPGVGGVRIEDDVLVTPRGHRVLCDLPKSYESTIIS